MAAYLTGSSSTITLDLVYEDGSAIEVQSVTYALYNKADVQLIAPTSVLTFAVGDTFATVTIAGINNTLAVSELSDVRKLLMFATTPTGEVVKLEKIYIIKSSTELSFMVNSYQTIQEAELTAYNIPNLEAFEFASQSAKTSALKEAFNHLGMMTYSVDYNYLGGSLDYVTEFNTMTSGSPVSNVGRRTTVVNKINLLPPSYIAMLPDNFIAKLRVAQVIEANYILSGDESVDDRVVTRKVGESTTTWGQNKVLSLSVSKRALESLTGYLHYGSNLGRG